MDKRVEIISTVARRRRWTIEEKVAILDEASQPRASITAVADRHGISRNLIYLWRRQAREGSMPGVTVTPAQSTSQRRTRGRPKPQPPQDLIGNLLPL